MTETAQQSLLTMLHRSGWGIGRARLVNVRTGRRWWHRLVVGPSSRSRQGRSRTSSISCQRNE